MKTRTFAGAGTWVVNLVIITSMVGAGQPSVRPPGRPPIIEHSNSIAIPKVDGSLNQLYRQRFDPITATRGPSSITEDPVSLVVESVAADAVSTVTYGPSDGQPWLTGTGFFGTSASCPHVAGGAALLLEESPSLDPMELKDRLLGSAMDMGPTGPDNDFGFGMLYLEASVIFADGFESGDTTAWSDTSP